MKELWDSIRKYQKAYILLAALAGTVVLVNEGISFAERIQANRLLAAMSLVIFYFFASILIEEVKHGKRKRK